MRFLGILDTNSFEDATFNAVALITWTYIEICIYVMAACVMMYRPVIEGAMRIGNIRSITRGTRGTSTMGRGMDAGNGIELPKRSQGGPHGFKRLNDGNSPVSSKLIRVTTNIDVTSAN